ncbi:hypothetical protein FRC02_002977 [Tulasnella sp. 418]|nr:hypothetical protein FRC02_002977 [Tulasnella sp. 418]
MPPKKNRGARGGGSGFLGGGGFLSNLNAAASSLGLEDDTPSDDSPPMNPLINHPWPDPFARQSRANLAPGPPASSQGATPQPSGNSTSNGPSSQPPPHCPDLSPLTPSSSSGQQADTAVEITPDNSKVHPSAGKYQPNPLSSVLISHSDSLCS